MPPFVSVFQHGQEWTTLLDMTWIQCMKPHKCDLYYNIYHQNFMSYFWCTQFYVGSHFIVTPNNSDPVSVFYPIYFIELCAQYSEKGLLCLKLWQDATNVHNQFLDSSHLELRQPNGGLSVLLWGCRRVDSKWTSSNSLIMSGRWV